MTDGLRNLLQHYGILSVTMHALSGRPGTSHKTIEEYDKALGDIQPDEPILIVRVSKDADTRLIGESDTKFGLRSQVDMKVGKAQVLELPEDEFWFFSAFRPGLFELNKDLPSFIYEMGLTNAYAKFEHYLSDLLRTRLRLHPKLMGGQREIRYDQVFAANSKDELIDSMVEREIKDLVYLPLLAILKKMREQLGFRSLTNNYDAEANNLSLLRNCLLHNNGIADGKLAAACPAMREGEKASISIENVNKAIHVLRKLAYEIDQEFENRYA